MNFLKMIYHNLRYGAASTVIFIDNQVDAALAAMVRVILSVFAILFLGTVLGFIGYIIDAFYVMRAAQYIYAIGLFAVGLLSLVLAARMGVLITVLPIGYEVVRKIIRQVSDPIPFADPIDLPELMSQKNAEWIYKALWATLATLQFAILYALIFAAYTNPLSLIAVFGLSWGILFGALTVGIAGGQWLKRYGYINLGISLCAAVCYTLTYPFPNIWTNLTTRWGNFRTAFNGLESLANGNYWVALFYFVVVAGLLVSIAYAALNKGKGVPVAVGFLILLMFMIILGKRTVAEVTDLRGNLQFGDHSSLEVSTYPGVSTVPYSTSEVVGNGKVYVSAKDYNGIDTQIEIKSGSVIEVKASGKAVWKNIPVGNPTKYEESGPSGTLPNASPLMSESEYWSNIDQYLCPTAKKGALIAKIGNGPWFYVGDNYKGEVKSSGKLIFAINDVDPQKQSVSNWQDNSKGFQVAVKVS